MQGMPFPSLPLESCRCWSNCWTIGLYPFDKREQRRYLKATAHWSDTTRWTSSTRHSTRRRSTRAFAIRPVFAHLLTGIFTAEKIKAINHVQHGIAVDAIILGVGALIGVDRTREVALLAQQVVELDAHTKRTAFKEALRKLSIPHQFVGACPKEGWNWVLHRMQVAKCWGCFAVEAHFWNGRK